MEEVSSSEVINHHNTALIVGSCLWDILDAQDTLQGTNFDDHVGACREYIARLRRLYPGVTIVWKSPMAVHLHYVDLERVRKHDVSTATLFGLDRIRYMSRSRSRYIYERQKSLMQQLDVPFLDLYEATFLSADWLYPGDGRHYRPDFNRMMLSWFYNEQVLQGHGLSESSYCKYHKQVD